MRVLWKSFNQIEARVVCLNIGQFSLIRAFHLSSQTQNAGTTTSARKTKKKYSDLRHLDGMHPIKSWDGGLPIRAARTGSPKRSSGRKYGMMSFLSSLVAA